MELRSRPLGRARIVAAIAALSLTCAGCGEGTARPAPGDDDVTDDDAADDDAGDDDTADDDAGDDDSEACGYDQIEPDPDGSLFGLVSLDDDLQPRIDAGCDCHQVGNPQIEDLSPGKTWGSWVGQPSRFDLGEQLVVPGSPEESVVFWKVFDCYPLFPFVGGPMPPDAPALSLEDVTLYYNWILQGAEGGRASSNRAERGERRGRARR